VIIWRTRNLALVRADRLLSLALLLQARGTATARALAGELGVSVRTVYRDLAALAAAGVPVVTEAEPGGGCRLMEGYRFPLRGLRPDEAEALLILGVPAVLRELGLAGALTAAHRQIRVTAGVGSGTLVHLDMPRWFGGQEEVPCLRDLAQALRLGRKLAIRYPPPDREPRVVGPLGLVNKAGTWYLVADCVAHSGAWAGAGAGAGAGDIRVFRAGRVSAAPGPGGARRAAGRLRAGRVLGSLVGGVRGEQAPARGQAGRVAGCAGRLW
jgi:predicted DNA-binding transcriptional regulator YafY